MPVVFVGVDVVAAQDVVAGFAEHGDGVGGDQDQHGGVGVGGPDASVESAATLVQDDAPDSGG